MPQTILQNRANFQGIYGNSPVDLTTNITTTTLVTGLVASKQADKDVWFDGYLTYIITLTNDSDCDFVRPTLTDTIDITQITLVPCSVTVNGLSAGYNFDHETGLLQVRIPTVAANEKTTVKFKVKMRNTQKSNECPQCKKCCENCCCWHNCMCKNERDYSIF